MDTSRHHPAVHQVEIVRWERRSVLVSAPPTADPGNRVGLRTVEIIQLELQVWRYVFRHWIRVYVDSQDLTRHGCQQGAETTTCLVLEGNGPWVTIAIAVASDPGQESQGCKFSRQDGALEDRRSYVPWLPFGEDKKTPHHGSTHAPRIRDTVRQPPSPKLLTHSRSPGFFVAVVREGRSICCRTSG